VPITATASGIVTGQRAPTHIAAPITAQQCATHHRPRQDDRALTAAHSAALKKSDGWARGATAKGDAPGWRAAIGDNAPLRVSTLGQMRPRLQGAAMRRLCECTAWVALAASLAMTWPVWARAAAAPEAAVEGGSIQGRLDGAVNVFQGIRYAAAPIGNLRWREPQRVVPWLRVQPALQPGASCIQDAQMSIANGGDPRPTGEDCLFLNVWAPVPEPGAALKRPVMVWLHGGALIFGSGGLPVYDGAPLAARGAVVVTVNYRLGALGFFAHPSLANEGDGDVNFGLLDQIAALRWVQRNIASFGGDPDNVTIFGQSAGAESVLALFASPLAKGLFHKGIAQSPYGIPSHTLAKARATAAKVATALKLNGAKASAAELRAVPAEAFAAAGGKGESLAPAFVVGDRALPRPILASFQKGSEAKLPLIIGNTSDDGSVAFTFGLDPAALVGKLGAARIAVKSLYPKDLTDTQLGRETARDLVFTAFARRLAYLHSSRAPTWRYYYGYVGEGLRKQQAGVPHGGEIPYTMGTLAGCGCLGAPATAQDRAAAQRVSQHWLDFATTGTPVPSDAARWPRDDPRNAKLLEFGDTDTVKADFMQRRLNAFIGVLNLAGFFSPAK
jgi:para-nitrobenzyl esterase